MLRRRKTDFMDPSEALSVDGFAMLREAVAPDLIERLCTTCDIVPRAGIRNLFDAVPESRDLLEAPVIRDALRRVLGKAFVTRAILFDKSGAANWALPWHQDTVIAVDKRSDARGYGPWSVKEGVPHVRPPVNVLEGMLTVRVHLDDTDEANGALRVLPGAHHEGIVDAERLRELEKEITPVTCEAKAGDALLIRPLVPHASGRSADPDRRRRIVHLEFGARKLPGGVRWARP